MTALSQEIIPDPFFKYWQGLAHPGDAPIDWAVFSVDANNYLEDAKSGVHFVSDGLGTQMFYGPSPGLPVGLYTLEYEQRNLVAGSLRWVFGGRTIVLPAQLGRHAIRDILTTAEANSVTLFASNTPLDIVLSYTSLKRQHTPPPARNVNGTVNGVGVSTGPIECARGHGVDVNLSGTLTGGVVDLERSDDGGVTWVVMESYDALGSFVVPAQSGWYYRLTGGVAFVGGVIAYVGQS